MNCLGQSHTFWLLLGLEEHENDSCPRTSAFGSLIYFNGSVPPLPSRHHSPCLWVLGSSNEFFKRVAKKKKKRSLVAGMKVRMMGLPTWETKWEVRCLRCSVLGWGCHLSASGHWAPSPSSQGLLEYGLKFRYSIFYFCSEATGLERRPRGIARTEYEGEEGSE